MRITNVEMPPAGTVVVTRRGTVTTVEGDVKVTLEDGSILVPSTERERILLGFAHVHNRSVENYGVKL